MDTKDGTEQRPHLLETAGNIFLSYYIDAAEKLDIKYEIVVRSLMARFEYKDKHWFIINTALPINSAPSATISKRKNLAYKVLSNAGVAAAEQVELRTEDEAIDFFNKYKDIVIKPVRNLGGKGVSILPKDEVQVVKAFNIAYEKCLAKTEVRVLAEKFIKGINYRILVLDDKVIGVVRRIPALVVGDGMSTIQELIEEKNKERHSQVLTSIQIDDELFKRLSLYGYDLKSVPNRDEEVHLRFNSNLTSGGTTEECADMMHEKYAQVAIDATKALGLKLGGVDLIAEDITNPDAEFAINEVNWNPGLRVHYMADKGKRVEVAIPIMEYIRDHYQA